MRNGMAWLLVVLMCACVQDVQFSLLDTGHGWAGFGDQGGSDPGTPDPGTPDPGTPDPGTPDPGQMDPGPIDPGPIDPGPTDPGPTDPGPIDPGPTDPGPTDPGPTDPGTLSPCQGDGVADGDPCNVGRGICCQGTCVDCDRDLGADERYCYYSDSALASCVRCTENNHCGDGQYCNGSHVCKPLDVCNCIDDDDDGIVDNSPLVNVPGSACPDGCSFIKADGSESCYLLCPIAPDYSWRTSATYCRKINEKDAPFTISWIETRDENIRIGDLLKNLTEPADADSRNDEPVFTGAANSCIWLGAKRSKCENRDLKSWFNWVWSNGDASPLDRQWTCSGRVMPSEADSGSVPSRCEDDIVDNYSFTATDNSCPFVDEEPNCLFDCTDVESCDSDFWGASQPDGCRVPSSPEHCLGLWWKNYGDAGSQQWDFMWNDFDCSGTAFATGNACVGGSWVLCEGFGAASP